MSKTYDEWDKEAITKWYKSKIGNSTSVTQTTIMLIVVDMIYQWEQTKDEFEKELAQM